MSHAEVNDLEAAVREAAAGRRAVVLLGGKRLAVVPAEDLTRLEDFEAEDEAEDADLLAAALAAEAEAEARGEAPVPWAEADARLSRLP